jgi:hypothetical protein
MKARYSLFLLVLVIQIRASAFLSLSESNDITPRDKVKVGLEPQIRLSEGSGTNVSVFVDKGLREDLSVRAQLGAGETDFQATGSVKWVPIPDFDKQPAVGVRLDLTLGRAADTSLWAARVAPMVSKSFEIEYGKLIPYAALPLGAVSIRSKNDTFVQLALGSEYIPEQLENFMFGAELGTNITKAFSYIAFNVTYLISSDKSSAVRKTRK